MVVGLEEGQENLTHILPSRVFEKGDIIWLVGEEADLQKIQELMKLNRIVQEQEGAPKVPQRRRPERTLTASSDYVWILKL